MSLKIQSISHGSLHWQSDLPPSFTGIRLPGAALAAASGDFGTLCIQEFNTDYYTIRYFVIHAIQRFVIKFRSKEKGICIQLALKGNVEQNIKTGFQLLAKNQFSLFTSPLQLTASYNKETIYHGFDTFFSKQMIEDVLKDYPSLLQTFRLYNNAGTSIPIAQWSDATTLELVDNVLHCRYENDLRSFYFNSRVRDLLFQYLVQLGDHDPTGEGLSEKEMNAVYKAEQIINEDISRHYLIPELSMKIALNEFRFKAAFKKIFGMGPYEYLVRQRMKKAKVLLQSGLSVKEVAAQTGYRPTDFTSAFMNFYGFTPSSVKKKN